MARLLLRHMVFAATCQLQLETKDVGESDRLLPARSTGFRRLKFKSESRLRQREKDGRVTVWRFGSLYIVWEARSKNAEPDSKNSTSPP